MPDLQLQVQQHRELQAAHEDSRQRPPEGTEEPDHQRDGGYLLRSVLLAHTL